MVGLVVALLATAHALIAQGILNANHLLAAAAIVTGLAPAMAVFGGSGTIYDAAPVASFTFKVGSADLSEPLWGGFQAAHIWVNNSSNQYLYLEDAPDVVAPGVTRVVAIKHTDVARASWNIPSQFAVTQPNNPVGAAILIWLNAGIEIAPTPGVSNTPTVSSPQVDLGPLVVAAASANSGTFKVPTGTHAIGLLIENGAGLSQITVIGAQSGTKYLSLPPFGASATLQGFVMSAALSAVDSQVIVSAESTGGATVEVVAVLQAAAEFVFNNPTQPLNAELVGVSGAPLGDTGAPALSKDQGTETITYAPGVTNVGGVLASFKAAAGQVVDLVGVVGAFTIGNLVQVNPTFGQATSAGNLLVCCVGAGTGEPATVAAGWVKAKSDGVFAPWSAIWYKPNCGAAEAAPQFTSAAGSSAMFAQLFEYSGAAIVAPLDQTGSAGGAATSLTVPTAAVDAAFGDLVVMATRWVCNLNATPAGSFTDSMNNGMTAVQGGNGFSTQNGVTRAMSFSFGIVPAATAALPFGIVPWDYDATGTSAPAVGTTASVILAAAPGKSYRANSLDGSLISIAAVATAPAVQLKDGATIIWQQWLGLSATAEAEQHFEKTGASYKGTPGNSMTLAFTGNVANVAQAVNIGAHLR